MSKKINTNDIAATNSQSAMVVLLLVALFCHSLQIEHFAAFLGIAPLHQSQAFVFVIAPVAMGGGITFALGGKPIGNGKDVNPGTFFTWAVDIFAPLDYRL